MSASGERACANARLRAWRSRLLRRADVMPLLAATDRPAHERALAAIGAATGGEAWQHAFERLLNVYRIAIRGYREYALLFVALLRLHEIENLKLAWRAVARHLTDTRWHSSWRPLGSLAAITLEECRRAGSITDLVELLYKTPYGRIAFQLHRAHGDDLTAIELGLDRWASDQLLVEAEKLPAAEGLSAAIIGEVVRRRDSQLAERGTIFGLSSGASAESASVQRSRALDYPGLLRRAARGGPFSLAPALSIVLLAEEELRGVIALSERRGLAELDAAVSKVLEPSLMGAA